MDEPRRRRSGALRRRLGLRGRVMLAFGLLALGLSLVLSLLTWTLVTRTAATQSRQSALTETALNRSHFESLITSEPKQIGSVLDNMRRTGTVEVLTQVGGDWYASPESLVPELIPASLRAQVLTGDTQIAEIDNAGTPYFVVGAPLARGRGEYFEFYSRADEQRAARTLVIGLSIASVITVFLGLALGRFAIRVAMRPLITLGQVAADVAGGRLDARIDVGADADLRELATSFNSTVDALERRVGADARFAVDVGHELRTPLTTMLNSMQVIENRRDQLPVEVREPLELLAEELQRFRSLVVDLLEISRDDAGDQMVLEQVNVGELVRHAADAAAGRPITIVDPQICELTSWVDKRRLERVIANLVRNAEVHGGGCTSVRIEPGGRGLRLLVDDAGSGIPHDRRLRVFERFARGASPATPGVGLGLSIVQRHVALHGGSVRIEDAPDGGARFVVELPVAEGDLRLS